MFEQFNITVVDADIVAREVVAPKTKGLKEIKAHFGDQVLNEDGSLNRAQLRHIIFTDESQKNVLEIDDIKTPNKIFVLFGVNG